MYYLYSVLPMASSELTYQSFIHEYNFILIIAIFSLAFSVILRAVKILLIQVVFFFGVIVFKESITTVYNNLLIIFQILGVLFVLYKVKKALDWNYTLILEKTHQIPRQLTKDGQSGSQSTFF